MKNIRYYILFAIIACTTACSRSFEPFDYGKEECTFCKMTIVDPRYSAEIIDKKGKIYKFDDIACMKHYMVDNKMQENDLNTFVSAFRPKNTILDAQKAFFIQNEYFKSPMKGNTAAFDKENDAKTLNDSLHASIVSWSALRF